MVVFPNAKINLGLHIVEKRPDNFHNIETVFYPVTAFTDILETVQSNTFSFNQTGIKIYGSAENNLCVKAYNIICKAYNLPPVSMHLHKIIPTGAGLGGGSADASFVLKMLNNIFKLNISDTKLKEYAMQLGSDCAFFIENRPCLASGRGEILTPIDVNLQGYRLVLLKPDVFVSTAEAYAGVSPQKPKFELSEIIKLPVSQWKDKLVNDFEESIFLKYPLLGEIKNSLYESGAVYAAMSGSGTTVFGLFDGKSAIPDFGKLQVHSELI